MRRLLPWVAACSWLATGCANAPQSEQDDARPHLMFPPVARKAIYQIDISPHTPMTPASVAAIVGRLPDRKGRPGDFSDPRCVGDGYGWEEEWKGDGVWQGSTYVLRVVYTIEGRPKRVSFDERLPKNYRVTILQCVNGDRPQEEVHSDFPEDLN